MNSKSEISSYSAILDKKYGKAGTPKRKEFDEEALFFYASQIILQGRKQAHLTQKQLAQKAGIDESYISRIETGIIQPTVATFVKILHAMGKQLEVV